MSALGRVAQGLLQTLPHLRGVQRTAQYAARHGCPSATPFHAPQLASISARFKSTKDQTTALEDKELEKRRKHKLALESNFDEDPEKASGKTVVNILNHETDEGILFTSYSCIGFRLSNGMQVMGPCAVFPRSILHWNIRNARSITEASLRYFTLLDPKLDILVLGVGEAESLQQLDPKIIMFLRSNKINVEILPTAQALATFNFLNSEKRYVAAALIPPSYMEEDRFDDGDTRFSSMAAQQGDALFKTKEDYDYIPPGHERGMTDEIWDNRYKGFKDTLYGREERAKDMEKYPNKYRE